MANNHTTSVEIKLGINSEGYFSFNEPDTLLIFIHGFGGKALATWNNFPLLAISDDTFIKCDLIYYGYDTFKGQAGDHAAELYDFIGLAMHPLTNSILPLGQKLKERKYSRIILVAHSLGALLARQAQLLAYHAKKDWVQRSQLALYAPAHNGAAVISLAQEALSGIYGLMALFARWRFPILTDLSTNDNGIIDHVRSKTEALQRAGRGDFSKARLVVYAKGDRVVKNFQYGQDTPPSVIAGTTHTAVCKPKQQFLKPIELLKQII